MGKPITVTLAHGEMIIHSCGGSAYDKIRKICGLEKSNVGDFVYLSDGQIEQLKSLSGEVCIFKSFLDDVYDKSPNEISGGVVATLTSDCSSLPWVMIHVHRYGSAKGKQKYDVKAGDDVIKEDIIALSASAVVANPASAFQRFHADYSTRYVFDYLYKKRMEGITKGVVFNYNNFLTSNNGLCCDVVQQPYQGSQEMISSLEEVKLRL